MKICMLSYSFYESDARIRQYATALTHRGDSVEVIALRKAGNPYEEILEGVKVFRIQGRHRNERSRWAHLLKLLWFLLHSAWVLTRLQIRNRYDLIHVHSVPDFLVFAAIIPKLLTVPIILDIHDLLPELYAGKFGERRKGIVFWLMVQLEKWSAAFADHVIVANDIWRERLLRRSVACDKCTAMRNFPDPSLFHPRSKARAGDTFLLMYPGSLNWHQGVDIAIRAFARVADVLRDAQFHIYGEGAARHSLEQLVKELSMEGRVVIHDMVPTAQIAKIMSSCDLAIEPKRSKSSFGTEALSMKILEFMAAGVPVVASDTLVHRYYYDDTVVKFFHDDSEEELAHCMVFMKEHPELRAKLVKNAAKYFAENNWSVKSAGYLQIVDGLAASRSKSAAKLQRVVPASRP